MSEFALRDFMFRRPSSVTLSVLGSWFRADRKRLFFGTYIVPMGICI
jgi:hypothetical protein